MSEYQYYEFLAIDRRLGTRETAQLRALSTRAEITPVFETALRGFMELHGKRGALVKRPVEAGLRRR